MLGCSVGPPIDGNYEVSILFLKPRSSDSASRGEQNGMWEPSVPAPQDKKYNLALKTFRSADVMQRPQLWTNPF